MSVAERGSVREVARASWNAMAREGGIIIMVVMRWLCGLVDCDTSGRRSGWCYIDGSSSCRTRERGRRRHGGWIKILYPKFRIEDDYVLKHM